MGKKRNSKPDKIQQLLEKIEAVEAVNEYTKLKKEYDELWHGPLEVKFHFILQYKNPSNSGFLAFIATPIFTF